MDKFPLASCGWRYVAVSLFLALVAQALEVAWLAWPLWIFAAFSAYFFRDPARRHQAMEHELVSPADGKVVAVEDVVHPALPGEKALLVSIFMNLFDVHVNRLPISGKVLNITRMPGGFMPADRENARLQNERVEVVLQTDGGKTLAMTQVAGLVARRIENSLIPGEQVQKGSRFGMIRFGSRVDLYLPPESVVQVALGARVKAGKSVMGKI